VLISLGVNIIKSAKNFRPAADRLPGSADGQFTVKRSKVNLQGSGAYCNGLPHSLFVFLKALKLHEVCLQSLRTMYKQYAQRRIGIKNAF